MLSISNILLPTDFSAASLTTAHYATALARHFNSSITVLHVMPPPNLPPDVFGMPTGAVYLDEILDALKSAARNRLDSFVINGLDGSKVKRNLTDGDPASEIVRVAHSEAFDLIMMATKGYGPFRRFILGSVTAKVLHDAHLPVWTDVHVEEMNAPPSAEIRSIVCAVAVNGEPQSLETLCWASNMASEFKARLILVHAIPSLQLKPGTYYFETDFQKLLLSQAKEQVTAMAQKCGLVDVGIYIDGGNVSDVVRAAVQIHKADLVIVGRPSNIGIVGRLRTSTYSTIRDSPCPVVSV